MQCKLFVISFLATPTLATLSATAAPTRPRRHHSLRLDDTTFPLPSAAKRMIHVRGGAAAAARRVKPRQVEAAAPGGGTASIPSEVFNLIKTIVGAGVLGLPAGIAAFGDAPSAILPAMAIMVSIAVLSSYGFSILGLLCGRTQSTSYRQVWRRTVGDGSSWMPALACILVTCASVLTYSIILSHTIPAIVEAVTGWTVSRTLALLSMTLLILLPLCLMRNLASLAPFSLVGIMGMIYTGAVMTYRCLSHSYAPDTALTASLSDHLVPRFGQAGWRSVVSSHTAILVSMLSTAFMAHYNAPRFFHELSNNTMPRFNRVICYSFTGAVVLMATVAAAGFGTFGAASSSLILNNYSVQDQLMSLSRVGVSLSLMCSYPLSFSGVREGLLDLANINDPVKRYQWSHPLTVFLLALVTAGAFVVQDIQVVMAVGGATWGNCVIYLFPAYMLVQFAAKNKGDADLQKRVPWAVAMGLLGLILGMVGTTQALLQ